VRECGRGSMHARVCAQPTSPASPSSHISYPLPPTSRRCASCQRCYRRPHHACALPWTAARAAPRRGRCPSR
jgi:hypothetical protein